MPSISPTLRRIRFRNRSIRRAAVWWRFTRAGLNPEDAFLVSYPRSGTTWLRFLLFEALTQRSADFGLMRQGVASLTKHHGAAVVLGDRGRLIQSHEPYSDGDRRVIYAVRDARSVALSEYSWQQRLGLEPGSLDHFIHDFVRGRSNPWGAWDRHVRYWLSSEPAQNNHLELIRFEDLKQDTTGKLKEVLAFLGVERADDELQAVVESNSVDRMRAKEDEARERGWRSGARGDIRFINQGSVAGWREVLMDAQRSMIEERFGATMASLGYLPDE